MSGKAIGESFNLGYAGTVSRNNDNIIISKAVKSEEEILFGQALALEDDNTVRVVKEGDTSDKFIGIAVREVKQAINYYDNAGGYLANDNVDILTRGTITVKCNHGTPKAGENVYLRIKENSDIVNGIVGEFEAEADGENTILLENVKFTTGQIDNNNITEIVILTRNI